MDSYIYLKSIEYIRDIKFYKLNEWFQNPIKPTFDTTNCIGIQLTSTTWQRQRPPIVHWNMFSEIIKNSKLQPFFHGSILDGEKILSIYPNAKELCKDEKYWRFGKDDILQTIANLQNCFAAISIGSWSAHPAVLQGVPTLDLWPPESWQFFSPMVRHLIGNPIHYLQDSILAIPSPFLLTECLPYLRSLAKVLYNF